MRAPEHYGQILRQLSKIPRRFLAEELGSVTDCIWDGVHVDVEGIKLRATRRGWLEFEGEAPTERCIEISSSTDWDPEFVQIQTQAGFVLRAKQGTSTLKWASFGGSESSIVASVRMVDWAALKDSDQPCLWVTFANIDECPRGLKNSAGNLRLKGFDDLSETGHWIFRACYTTLLIQHPSGWLLCIDTGTQDPPAGDLGPELRMLGYLQGHPFNLAVAHRLSGDGTMSGHAQMMTGHVGHSAPLRGCPTPFMQPLFRVDFFDKAMSALKLDPALVMVPTGHHFEGHGRTLESCFAHAWIALESLVTRGERHGFIQKGMPKLADKTGWEQWVDANAAAIKGFASQGNEELFFNIVRGFITETSKVRAAFKKLGLPWTLPMDQLGALRGEYIHEGTPRAYSARNTNEQLELLATMLTALYARLIGYEGPISDSTGISGPEWWTVGQTEANARMIVIEAP